MRNSLLCLLALAGIPTGASAIAPPTGLAQSDYDGHSLTLTWESVEGATEYEVSVWHLGESVTEAQYVNQIINKDHPTLYTPAVNGHLDKAVINYTISGTAGIDYEKTLPLIFRQADANHELSSIFRGDIYMGQLAITNQVSTYEMFGGYPVDEFTQCIYIEAGPSGSEPTGEGTMTVSTVVNTYRPNVYIMDHEATEGTATTMKVSGLDPATNYYATVKAIGGEEVSAASEILHLNSLVPTVLRPASSVTANSYTANWEANPKGSSYVVTNYEIISADGICQISENGAKCNGGTFDNPTTVESLDEYTDTKGWKGVTCLVADGMFGVADGAIRGGRPIGGYIYSPNADFSAYNGKVYITVSLHATPEDIITVYIGSYSDDKAHAITIPESGIVTESFEIIGGTNDNYIRFESKNLKKFFIRSITASQGEPVENILLEDSFDKSTSGTFDSPIERISADDYTEMPGWNINSAIAAAGMLGTFDGMFIGGRPYGGGAMVTPALGFADGDATVSFRLQSSKPGEDQITVYIGDYDATSANVFEVPADGIIDETVTLSGACDGATVHFESKNLKKFMLDDIKVYQTLAPGQKSYKKLESATVTGATSHTFTGLESGKRYGYSVRTDYLNFFGMSEEGAESAVMEVSATSGIESVAGSESPVVSVIYTDLTGRRVIEAAPGSIVIRTAVHADGSRTVAKQLVR